MIEALSVSHMDLENANGTVPTMGPHPTLATSKSTTKAQAVHSVPGQRHRSLIGVQFGFEYMMTRRSEHKLITEVERLGQDRR